MILKIKLLATADSISFVGYGFGILRDSFMGKNEKKKCLQIVCEYSKIKRKCMTESDGSK